MKESIFIFSLLFTSIAAANVDLDVKHECIVTESNNAAISVGARTKFPISLREVSGHGMIPLDRGSIFLYSKLETLMSDSGKTVLAVDPTAPKETQGSIFADQVEDGLKLDISVFETTRVFDVKTGWPVFVLKKAPSVYKLACTAVSL